MSLLQKKLPWVLGAAFALYLAAGLLPPSPGPGPDLRGFASLPVLHNGRVKPVDTLARSTLLMLRGKQSVVVDGRRLSASQWLLDLMTRPEAADGYKVFQINDPDVLGLLGKELDLKEKDHSFNELEPYLDTVRSQADAAMKVEPQARSRFQTDVSNLRDQLLLYQRLKNSLEVAGTPDFPAELRAYEEALGPGLKAVRAHGKSGAFDHKALEALNGFFERYQFLHGAAAFFPLPPQEGEPKERWTDMGQGLLEALRSGTPHPAALGYAGLAGAWRAGDAAGFAQVLGAMRGYLQSACPGELRRASFEEALNRFEPFYRGMALYLAAVLLIFVSWLAWGEALQKSAFVLLALAFVVHTGGLAARMVLQGRPPVTNLYSSAIYVGWAAVLLGLVLERLYKKGFGSLVAGLIGFSTLIIAHHLQSSGDTMEMMRAVLDSNFWLATHVVAITTGYSSTFLAGALAAVYILRGALTPSLSRDSAKSLVSMTYGVICFSLFFSFVGTCLGGIWADQSWGRFWGWDPKENGALIIVLWNAIILHARWGGYVRERGLMALAVFGNIVTALSWFGVNMLGIGLHSYGWMDKAFYWLAAFTLSQLAIMAVGLLPVEKWRSFQAPPPSPAKDAKPVAA